MWCCVHFFYVRVMCGWQFERECGAVRIFYVRVMCGCQFERECGAVCIFLCEGDVWMAV